MPPLTYIHASEAARTTAGGGAEATANVAADAMQKELTRCLTLCEASSICLEQLCS